MSKAQLSSKKIIMQLSKLASQNVLNIYSTLVNKKKVVSPY